MMTKVLTSLKKIGGSFYALIPTTLVKDLNLYNDETVLAEFEKFKDVYKELCKTYCETGQKVVIKTKEEKEIKGVIAFADNRSFTIVCDEKNYILPYSFIREMDETK